MAQKNEKLGFLSWMKRFPVKFALLAFLIIVPITLLLVAYLGPTTANKKFYFEVETVDKKKTIHKQSELTSISDLDDVSLTFKIKDIIPATDDNDQKYLFEIVMTDKEKTVSNVRIDAFLRIPMTQLRSEKDVNKTITYTNRITELSIDFNHDMPYKSFLFGTSNYPDLFLKITINYSSGDPLTYYSKVTF